MLPIESDFTLFRAQFPKKRRQSRRQRCTLATMPKLQIPLLAEAQGDCAMFSSGGINRRSFLSRLQSIAAGVCVGSGCNWAWAAPEGDSAEWAFPLLGDRHFDPLDHHGLEWLKREHTNDLSQVRNYS